MVAAMSVGLSSCSDDDDNDKNGLKSMVDTSWRDYGDDWYETVSFGTSRSGSIISVDEDGRERHNFTYTYSGGKGTMNVNGWDYGPYTFTVSGSHLVIYDADGNDIGPYTRI